MVRIINKGLEQAAAAGRVVDRDTARRIAAAVHRGFEGELERFAATGQLLHHHAARLELFYTLKNEPKMTAWGAALRDFITQDARTRSHTKLQAAQQGTKPGTGMPCPGQPAGARSGGLPLANPGAAVCGQCNPDGVVVYVRHDRGDPAKREGLALHRQHQTCRWYTRHGLRKRLEATFVDNTHTRRAGLERLLAHLAVCHNNRVVVDRLDRLPPGSRPANQVAERGARVLSASEQNPRTRRQQMALGRDVTRLVKRECEPSGRSRS
jgi:hypothetical protein